MNCSFWEYLDIHGMKIILVVIIFLVGFFVGVNVEEEPEQPCGKIIFESNHLRGLTEEEISRKFTEWLNDNVEVTIKINETDTIDWGYFPSVDPETDLMELP
jgi:hypothetical protein